MNVSQAITAAFGDQPVLATKMESVPLTDLDNAFLVAIEETAQQMPGSGTVIINYTSSEDGSKVNFTIPVIAASPPITAPSSSTSTL